MQHCMTFKIGGRFRCHVAVQQAATGPMYPAGPPDDHFYIICSGRLKVIIGRARDVKVIVEALSCLLNCNVILHVHKRRRPVAVKKSKIKHCSKDLSRLNF